MGVMWDAVPVPAVGIGRVQLATWHELYACIRGRTGIVVVLLFFSTYFWKSVSVSIACLPE
jgi:hypothetical protein